jgi:hypothetical protein
VVAAEVVEVEAGDGAAGAAVVAGEVTVEPGDAPAGEPPVDPADEPHADMTRAVPTRKARRDMVVCNWLLPRSAATRVAPDVF